jgi:hydroxymethylbilane synthase
VRTEDAGVPPYSVALGALDDAEGRATAVAERALLAALEAGCAAPVGATAHVTGGELRLRGLVYRLDGGAQLSAEASVAWARGAEAAAGEGLGSVGVVGASLSADELPVSLGRQVAEQLLVGGAADLAPLGAGA